MSSNPVMKPFGRQSIVIIKKRFSVSPNIIRMTYGYGDVAVKVRKQRLSSKVFLGISHCKQEAIKKNE